MRENFLVDVQKFAQTCWTNWNCLFVALIATLYGWSYLDDANAVKRNSCS